MMTLYNIDSVFDDWNIFFRDLRASDSHYNDLLHKKLSVPANIYADDEKMSIEIAIVGADPDDIIVKKIDTNVIKIKYEKKSHEDESGRHYFSKSISKKDIDLQLKIDAKYDIDKIEPKYSAGLLSIIIPLKENAEPKQFKVT